MKIVNTNEEMETHPENRRKSRRFILKHLLQIYCVVDNQRMYKVELVNVSETGCAFRIGTDKEHAWLNNFEKMAVRFYFSEDTYLPVVLQMKASRPFVENGKRFILYGCAIDQNSPSYATFKRFIYFLEAYAEMARRDLGDLKVSYF